MSSQPYQSYDPQRDLRDEVVLLKKICRAATALLSRDDDIETTIRWARTANMDEYRQARKAYYDRFGKTPP